MSALVKATAGIASYESDAAYHADRERLSGSALDMFESNPRRFAAWMRGEWEQETTPAMAFGSLFHALVLEPDTVHERFTIEPENPDKPGKSIHRGTKAYKTWRAEAEESGKTIVSMEDMALLKPMCSALGESQEVVDLVSGEGGRNEVPLFFDVGRPMRAKVDRIIEDRDIIVELKTCRSAVPGEAVWQWYQLGYHRKAWLYLEAYRQVFGRNASMVHVFVEKNARYPQVSCFWTYPDSPAAQWGEIQTREILARLRGCEEAGDFRGPHEPGAPGSEVVSLPLPGPILSQLEFAQQGPVELEVDGEVVGL